MNDEQLEKWNLRFCPKCRGHIRIGRAKNPDGQKMPIKYCQNTPTCDYKVFLSQNNISDNDRHKIIEEYFGYNIPFSLDNERFISLSTNDLLFDSVDKFFDWYVVELSKYHILDHNTLPVSSPYWLIIKNLGQFFSQNYYEQLRQFIKKFWDTFTDEQKRNLKDNSHFDYKIFW